MGEDLGRYDASTHMIYKRELLYIYITSCRSLEGCGCVRARRARPAGPKGPQRARRARTRARRAREGERSETVVPEATD